MPEAQTGRIRSGGVAVVVVGVTSHQGGSRADHRAKGRSLEML